MTTGSEDSVHDGSATPRPQRTLGQRIRTLRKSRKLSLEMVAATLGTDKHTVVSWERDAAVPSVNDLLPLAWLLGQSATDLLTGQPTRAGYPLGVLQSEKMAKMLAKILAMIVRNHMENFHCAHLSDAQMKELNPLIRNAIYTGLHHIGRMRESRGSEQYLEWPLRLVPKYWEEPELIFSDEEVDQLAQEVPARMGPPERS